MNLSDFDALELHTVIPVEGPGGVDAFDQIDNPHDLIPGFQHGLYGHIPAGGIEWIADFDTPAEARGMAAEVSEGREIYDYLVEPPTP